MPRFGTAVSLFLFCRIRARLRWKQALQPFGPTSMVRPLIRPPLSDPLGPSRTRVMSGSDQPSQNSSISADSCQDDSNPINRRDSLFPRRKKTTISSKNWDLRGAREGAIEGILEKTWRRRKGAQRDRRIANSLLLHLHSAMAFPLSLLSLISRSMDE